MKTIKSIISIAYFLLNSTIGADPVLVLTLKPYPMMPDDEYCQQITHSFRQLGKLSQQCLFGILDKRLPVGIFATYGGYLNVSDSLGEIDFPYKQTKPIITLLITPRIFPIFMVGNTVHHWMLDKNAPATMFEFALKKDELSDLMYWDVQPKMLPSDSAIPLNTIIILAKPHHIYVPQGATVTQESSNVVLPPIYVKKGINNVTQPLYALNIKHLFEPIRYLNKNEVKHGLSLIRP